MVLKGLYPSDDAIARNRRDCRRVIVRNPRQVIARYEPMIREVLEWLEADELPISIEPPRSLRQADERSSAWEARYRQLAAAAGVE